MAAKRNAKIMGASDVRKARIQGISDCLHLLFEGGGESVKSDFNLRGQISCCPLFKGRRCHAGSGLSTSSGFAPNSEIARVTKLSYTNLSSKPDLQKASPSIRPLAVTLGANFSKTERCPRNTAICVATKNLLHDTYWERH